MSRGVMKMAPTVLAVVISTDSATSPCAMYVATLLACGGYFAERWRSWSECEIRAYILVVVCEAHRCFARLPRTMGQRHCQRGHLVSRCRMEMLT